MICYCHDYGNPQSSFNSAVYDVGARPMQKRCKVHVGSFCTVQLAIGLRAQGNVGPTKLRLEARGKTALIWTQFYGTFLCLLGLVMPGLI